MRGVHPALPPPARAGPCCHPLGVAGRLCYKRGTSFQKTYDIIFPHLSHFLELSVFLSVVTETKCIILLTPRLTRCPCQLAGLRGLSSSGLLKWLPPRFFGVGEAGGVGARSTVADDPFVAHRTISFSSLATSPAQPLVSDLYFKSSEVLSPARR